MRFVLMGTGPFAVPAFEAIAARCDNDASDRIVAVVTRPVRGGKSRGGPPPTPVRDWSAGRDIPVWDPASINDEASVERLRTFGADLMVVCDYGQILSDAALQSARLGGINLHGSLLPKYRGAAPVQWAVLSGDVVAGVSVLHMTPRLDGGPILATAEIEVLPTETAGELEMRLSQLGVQPTLDAIEMLRQWDGQAAIGQIQSAELVTKAPRLAKADGAIDWGRDAAEIDAHVRGMQPWPVAYTMFRPRADKPPIRVAVRRVAATDRPVGDAVSGEIRVEDAVLAAAGDRWVELLEVQPAGKKPMTAMEMMRGHSVPEGSRFFE